MAATSTPGCGSRTANAGVVSKHDRVGRAHGGPLHAEPRLVEGGRRVQVLHLQCDEVGSGDGHDGSSRFNVSYLTSRVCQNPDMAQARTVGPVEDSLGYVLKQASVALRSAMDAALRPLRLSVTQYSCLELLGQRVDLSSAELARGTFVTRQSMHTVLRDLQERGLVTRPAVAAEGRALPARLTEDGPGGAGCGQPSRRCRGGADDRAARRGHAADRARRPQERRGGARGGRAALGRGALTASEDAGTARTVHRSSDLSRSCSILERLLCTKRRTVCP